MATKKKEDKKEEKGSPWSGDLSKFGEFLKKHNVLRHKFADKFDVTPAYVSMLAHGKATPGLKLSLQILEWTRSEKLPAFGPEDWGVLD